MSAGLEPRPELEDVGRLAGWLLRWAVTAARAQGDAPVRRALLTHLGPDAPGWPVVTASWPAYDHVNVQVGLVILPPDLLDGIERQVLGIARYAAALRASGQHLKRGVLLHGPPGTGKTHTVRYLLGRMPGVTAVVISGAAVRYISEACSIARALQPSVIVVEDVDLIAEQRGQRPGQESPLLQLLNEMDGLGTDADVTFLLTTHRPDLLEEALAARPGQVDHTARLPLPDAAARRRLLRLYQGNLHISRATAAALVDRTDGVTASFIKELLRRAALHAAVGANGKLTRTRPRPWLPPPRCASPRGT